MQRFVVVALLIAVASGQPLQSCSNDGDLIPNPQNCQEFFMCRSDTPIIFTCPENKLFNPLSSSCEPTDEVRCATGTIAKAMISSAVRGGSSTVEESNTMCVDSTVSTLLPDPESCSRFIQCTTAGPIAFNCPADMLFDAQLRTCKAAEVAKCGAGERQAISPILRPPVVRPPVFLPPVFRPPLFQPPIVRPPVILPPLFRPPVAVPPMVRPPVMLPPMVRPPVVLSPIVRPPFFPSPAVRPPFFPMQPQGNPWWN